MERVGVIETAVANDAIDEWRWTAHRAKAGDQLTVMDSQVSDDRIAADFSAHWLP